ncbi:MAG TPA: FGGY family carbohydrate kinase, partial [Anaerovoracaceae bacterium]|nr:FGGY family carbohydrate kinase [Anaerovoracaceae bacterium]
MKEKGCMKGKDCIATFDIGTTALKGVVVSASGDSIMEKSVAVETVFDGDYKEQRTLDWYSAFCEISNHFFSEGLRPDEVMGIAMSGQMQDLIPVAGDPAAGGILPVGNAILYSDGRAGLQAEKISGIIGIENIEKSTGNHFDGSMPFAKLLWLAENRPDIYTASHKVLISSKDYVAARLTGNYATDVTSASTAGLMDIREKRWNLSWMEKMGLDPLKLPSICYAEEKIGTVTEKASAESGFATGTPVYAGTGDAGATTLASGIASDGEFNINLGTSGWIACVSGDTLEKPGVFNLAAMQKGLYINVVPFLNAGNVHKWVSGILAPDTGADGKYEYIDGLLNQSEAGSNGVLFLPYLTGERFPVMDTAVKGGFAGIVPETTKQDLARSVLEGVAFSIRQGLEAIGRRPVRISLIGGGARVRTWCQILADVLGHSINVYEGAEYLPAAAVAGAVLAGQGRISGYAAYIESLLNAGGSVCYTPAPENTERYDRCYTSYLKLYPAFKSIYHSKFLF